MINEKINLVLAKKLVSANLHVHVFRIGDAANEGCRVGFNKKMLCKSMYC